MFTILLGNGRDALRLRQPQNGGDGRIRNICDQPGRPTQRGGRISHRSDGMAGIVLAVAKGALAVLPGLAPMNLRQAHEKGSWRERPRELLRRSTFQNAAPLQAVVPADVVIDAGIQARHLRKDCIAFRWVKVAAGRVAPQGPSTTLVLLPGRQSQGQLEQHRRAVPVQRQGRDDARSMEPGIGRVEPAR